MARPFGATNLPGTCLWCGLKLRPVYDTKREPAPFRRQKKCGICEYPQVYTDLDAGTYECSSCKCTLRLQLRYRIVSRTIVRDAPPHFHAPSCAEMFGRSAARDGVRMGPAKK